MIHVETFKPERDLQTIQDWYRGWHKEELSPDQLTTTGFMASWHENAGCAPIPPRPLMCGFLVLTNACFAFVETMIANPETTWQERELAASALTIFGCEYAKSLGFKRLLAFTTYDKLVSKGEKIGFTRFKTPFIGCVREL